MRRLQASLPVARARVRVRMRVRGKVRDTEACDPTLTLGNPNQASLPPSVPLLSIGRCLNNHHEPLLAIKPSHGQMSRALYGSK